MLSFALTSHPKSRHTSGMKKFLFSLLFLLPLSSAFANPQQLLQLVDYLGVDYAVAVDKGEIINALEYREMQDFSAGIQQQISQLPESKASESLLQDATSLIALVEEKAAVESVREVTARMRRTLVAAYKIQIMPRNLPDLNKAAILYQTNCASCHGESGFGDGIAGLELVPEPTNFHEYGRYEQRTLYSLYSTITEGVADTGMNAYPQLSDDERWSLAFLVGSMAVSKPSTMASVSADASPANQQATIDIKSFTNLTPAEVQAQFGETGLSTMAWLRHNPQVLFDNDNALDYSKRQLDKSLEAYQLGESKNAYRLAVDAYLEGFELIENSLQTVDSELKDNIESEMTDLRGLIRADKPVAEIEQQIRLIQDLLAEADFLLGSTSLSAEASFLSAFFILLREGLEALILVAALAAFLIKTGRRDALMYIHVGWVGALAAGGVTWWVSHSLISISGASREVTEGVAALTAAAVLLYVGVWLHNKTSAANWQAFINKSVEQALSSGTLWGLATLSFIAVYREVFETILFYEALWVQTNEIGKNMAVSGLISAGVLLAVIAWVMLKYSVLLPLRQFFAVSGGLMFILAIVFAGKGVAALQEAGILESYSVNFPRIDLLGIYPNALGLGIQLTLVLVAAGMLVRSVVAERRLQQSALE